MVKVNVFKLTTPQKTRGVPPPGEAILERRRGLRWRLVI